VIGDAGIAGRQFAHGETDGTAAPTGPASQFRELASETTNAVRELASETIITVSVS
jgi:hypothetical protein